MGGAPVEHAGELRGRRSRMLPLRLGEPRKRPCSSGQGAKQKDESRLLHFTSSLSLEPNVLEYLGRLAVQLGRSRVVAPPGGEVATGHPGCRLVADRLELLGAG